MKMSEIQWLTYLKGCEAIPDKQLYFRNKPKQMKAKYLQATSQPKIAYNKRTWQH